MLSVLGTGSGGCKDTNGSKIDNLVLKYHKGKFLLSDVRHFFSSQVLAKTVNPEPGCHGVQAADYTPSAKEVDHASALLALNKLMERMQSTEQELADMKFKVNTETL